MFLRVYAHEGKRLPKSFESFVAAISDWSGMFIEMDGSFVWSTIIDGFRYQIDGMVYDRENAIEYLELKGDLTPESWTRLMATLAENVDDPSVWDADFRVHDVALQRWITPTGILQAIQLSVLPPGGSGDAH